MKKKDEILKVFFVLTGDKKMEQLKKVTPFLADVVEDVKTADLVILNNMDEFNRYRDHHCAVPSFSIDDHFNLLQRVASKQKKKCRVWVQC